MQQILNKLKKEYPDLKFKAGKHFCWSPETNEIVYNRNTSGKPAIWSLLHETGHALLDHKSYKADFELLRLEVAAWDKAKQVASKLDVDISDQHIQDCLDTYRDWLYKRSICPKCTTKCLQQGDFAHYRCFNCHTTWKVSSSRFCRAYRSSKNIAQMPAIHF